MIDWSYSLLSEAEQVLFQRLSVFAGGWTLEAAEVVCADGEGPTTTDEIGRAESGHVLPPILRRRNIFDLLTHLVDKSLVVVEHQQGEARYRLLEMIRQYAREKLVEVGQAEAMQDRHLAYYLVLAEEGDRQLRGPEQMAWFRRLETELDNLRAAFAWSQASSTGGEAGLRLVGALEWFWVRRGQLSEGRVWLAAALAHPGAAGRTSARARALSAAYLLRDNTVEAHRTSLVESEAIWREVGDRRGLAWTLRCRGREAWDAGDVTRAAEIWRESSALFQTIDDRWGLAWTYQDQGDFLYAVHDELMAARRLFEMSVALFEAVGDRVNRAMALSHLAWIDEREENWALTQTRYEERLIIARILDDTPSMIWMLGSLAILAARQGDHDRATALFDESLTLQREKRSWQTPDMLTIGNGILALWRHDPDRTEEYLSDVTAPMYHNDKLVVLAGVALLRGDAVRAATLLGTLNGLVVAGQHSTIWFKYEHDLFMRKARAQLSEEAFAAAWAKGQGMTLEEAVAYALNRNRQEDA